MNAVLMSFSSLEIGASCLWSHEKLQLFNTSASEAVKYIKHHLGENNQLKQLEFQQYALMHAFICCTEVTYSSNATGKITTFHLKIFFTEQFPV